jgi:Flp pilus assembly protein TadG
VDRAGVAALEFALVAPVLLLLLGGVADFGLFIVGKNQLSNGVAQGVHYALRKGPSVSAATVQTMVREGASLAGVTLPVNVVVTGPECSCASGSPAALTRQGLVNADHTCSGTCPNGSTLPGIYIGIVATYTFRPLMPLYSQLTDPVTTQAATVRLQ